MCLMNRMMRDTLHGKDVENNSSFESIRRFLGLHTVNLTKNSELCNLSIVCEMTKNITTT